MTFLKQFGWNRFQQHNPTSTGELLGRVVSIMGFKYMLITEQGELEAELSGKLLYGCESDELPKVGDWVQYLNYGTIGYIVDVLPRTNTLSRKTPGSTTERQVLAANVDSALIVQGMDRDVNIMKLQRYLVQVKACNIAPVVVLNKADLVHDSHAYIREVSNVAPECRVLVCSTVLSGGINALKEVLEPYKTYVLIGSSGVGKSSLLNALLDGPRQITQALSEANHKGRHTTTTRHLFQLPNGSLLIDTPGMREFGVTHEEGQEALFPAIEKYAALCRYTDCHHLSEPGCAVLHALHTGELPPEVYESYGKLLKEQKRFQVRMEEKKRQGKQFGKMAREARDYRKKYKY